MQTRMGRLVTGRTRLVKKISRPKDPRRKGIVEGPTKRQEIQGKNVKQTTRYDGAVLDGLQDVSSRGAGWWPCHPRVKNRGKCNNEM